MALTKKQEIFCKEYVLKDDASAAYRIAYSASNMKSETINRTAHELLKTPKITARVGDLKKIAADIAKKEFQIDSKELLGHLNILRQSRIDQYVNFVQVGELKGGDKDGNEVMRPIRELQFKPFDELTEEQLMCIESIKNTRNGIELKLHGKDWTIEKIAKHIGFYEKDNTQKKSEKESVINLNIDGKSVKLE